jgi:hypothetical protein
MPSTSAISPPSAKVVQTMSANTELSSASSLNPFHSAIEPIARITKAMMDRIVRTRTIVPSAVRPPVARSPAGGAAAPSPAS